VNFEYVSQNRFPCAKHPAIALRLLHRADPASTFKEGDFSNIW